MLSDDEELFRQGVYQDEYSPDEVVVQIFFYIIWGEITPDDASPIQNSLQRIANFLDFWAPLFLGAVYVFYSIVRLACTQFRLAAGEQ